MDLSIIRLLKVYALLVGLASLLKAEEPIATNGQQLLLLRNGQAIEGRISRSGDIYLVALPEGEIRIKAADVELICGDFEEGYERKRATIQVGNLRDHLELAQWCQQHKMFDHAAAELAHAAAIAPKNPLVGLLQRRQQIAHAPPPAPSQAETAWEQPLSNEELDRMIRGLPPRAVENFTQSVQPLLMNNCTASGCHGSQSGTSLRLERIPSGQPSGRRLTQRNLYAVLQYIDRDNPLASPLLTIPTYPHGTSKTAIFTEKQIGQYKRLVDWALQLGPVSMPEKPAEMDRQFVQTEGNSAMESPHDAPRVLPHEAQKGRPLTPMYIRRGPGANLPETSWMDNPAAKTRNKAERASYQESESNKDKQLDSSKSSDARQPKIIHKKTE